MQRPSDPEVRQEHRDEAVRVYDEMMPAWDRHSTTAKERREQRIECLAKALAARDVALAEKDRELREAALRIAELREEADRVRGRLGRFMQHRRHTGELMGRNRRTLRDACASLGLENHEMRAERDRLREEIERLRQERSRYREYPKLRGENEKLRAEIARLE